MYIIHEDHDTINLLRSKYLVLELDTLEFPGGKTSTAYAVVDSEHVPLHEVDSLHRLSELHENLIANYRDRNWGYCHDAIEALRGKFKGEIDTFYDEIEQRINQLADIDLPDTWTGNVLTGQRVETE